MQSLQIKCKQSKILDSPVNCKLQITHFPIDQTSIAPWTSSILTSEVDVEAIVLNL
jgi:hypothetical protein